MISSCLFHLLLCFWVMKRQIGVRFLKKVAQISDSVFSLSVYLGCRGWVGCQNPIIPPESIFCRAQNIHYFHSWAKWNDKNTTLTKYESALCWFYAKKPKISPFCSMWKGLNLSQITPGRCTYIQESCQSFGEKKQKLSIRWASLLLQNICNRSNSFSLTQVSLSGREKPKHKTVQCRFHAVKEKSSPRVPHANKTCPECALIAMQTRFPALRHHLRPYFQLQCHEHLALTGLMERRRRGGSRQA